MTKKQIMKDYFIENVDFSSLKESYNDSWLLNKPFSWLYQNGIVGAHFFKHTKQAMQVAGYVYPDNDRNHETAHAVTIEILNDMQHYLRS